MVNEGYDLWTSDVIQPYRNDPHNSDDARHKSFILDYDTFIYIWIGTHVARHLRMTHPKYRYMYVYVYMCIIMCIYRYIYVYMYMYIYIFMCTHIYLCMSTHMYFYTPPIPIQIQCRSSSIETTFSGPSSSCFCPYC